jgi:hypothetical protein
MGSENPDKSNTTIQVLVAVLGLVGVLGGALIANWDKVFSRVEPQVAPVHDKSDSPKPSHSDPPHRSSIATPPAVPGVNISGVWRDPNVGTIYQVSQDGQSFRFSGSHATFESSGLGTIRGHILESSYQTRYRQGGISTGSCAGELSADGKQMVSRCADSLTGQWISLVVR